MQKSEKVITNSPQETQAFAKKLAEQILKRNPDKKAVVLALHGDLGSGKTTFLQGFAKGLGIKEVVNSPTFLITKKFKIPKIKDIPQNRRPSVSWYKWFYHLDCYRLENEKNLQGLGMLEILQNPENIIAIEWPERMKKILPKDIISIKFRYEKENRRALTLKINKLKINRYRVFNLF